ncbi:MAG: dicarboxylate/amino acid:cation symporter, partial [Pseudomonadota bacterium]
MKFRILLAALAGLALAILLTLAAREGLVHLSPVTLSTVRWIAIGAFAVYALARRTLTAWILVAMAAGAEIGVDAPRLAVHLKLLADIFLRLIKVIIAPLLFGTLVGGIAGHADIKSVGRMGVKALVYFEVVTTLALLIGLAAINLSRAGQGVKLPPQDPAAVSRQLAVTRTPPSEFILHIFPENIAKSVAENEVLEVVVFSVLFGIALTMVSEAKRRPMLAFAESLAEAMFKFTNIVMLYAPVGVGAAIAYTVGHTGLGI